MTKQNDTASAPSSTANIKIRAGYFTSSSIWKLMTNDRKGTGIGAPGLTYIEEKRLEKKLGRTLQQDVSPRSASWGTFVQHRVLNTLLGMEYKPTSDKRFAHPTIINWNGSPDFLRGKAVGDVKCFQLKNFCQTHDAATAGINTFKEECPEIYWQLVSNAILCDKAKLELVLYVPYKEELDAIREEAELDGGYEFQWIKYAKDDELPYLINGFLYKNLSSFVFDLIQDDKDALIDRVEMANGLLFGNNSKV